MDGGKITVCNRRALRSLVKLMYCTGNCNSQGFQLNCLVTD